MNYFAKGNHHGRSWPKSDFHGLSGSRTHGLTLWHEAIPIWGTLAERYLGDRLHELPPDRVLGPTLRFHPQCRVRDCIVPALVALLRDPNDTKPMGVLITALSDDGFCERVMPDGRSPYATLGKTAQTAVMPWRSFDLMGLTTNMSAALNASFLTDIVFWVVPSSKRLMRFPRVLRARELLILSEPDKRSLYAARCAVKRYESEGVAMRIVSPTDKQMSCNSALMATPRGMPPDFESVL